VIRVRFGNGRSEKALPAEMLGKQKTSSQVVTVIFFLALLSLHELRYANERSTWWFRAWAKLDRSWFGSQWR
jgi:hypothetical protein